MATPIETSKKPRQTLNRERVLQGAVAYADQNGLETLSMRKLAKALGVEAMSLYNHVANKDDLLVGMVEVVSQEFAGPTPDVGWKAATRASAIDAHAVLLLHPWACALAESRSESGPERMRYLEAVVGAMLEGGFNIEMAYHANLTLDSYIYGFTLQEVSWPVPQSEFPEAAAAFIERMDRERYPALAAMGEHVANPAYDPSGDFEHGLDLILDGLKQLLDVA
jgi:AcrR family transcriptional regulator